MIVKFLLRWAVGSSRNFSLLATTSTPSWTPTLTISCTFPTSFTPLHRGGILAIHANFVFKDHRHNIHNKILINNNNKNQNCLLDSSFSNDIKDKDLSKLKEDWEEEGVKCPHCDIGFTSSEALLHHLGLTGRGNAGGCKVLWKMRNEEDKKSGKLPYICDHDGCGIAFRWKSNLDEHKASHSDERPYSCDKCGKSYKLKATLNQHVRQKHSGQVFKCPECKKNFNQKSHMKAHLKICRQEEKEFKCSQCGLKYHTNGDLTRHIKMVHNQERPHKCELCDYTCSTKQVLKNHMSAVHENARPHKCEDCDAAFSTATDLNNHRIAKHTFDWPYPCHLCEKGYIKPGGLKKHMEAKHPVEYREQLEREKPAVCPHCGKRFMNEKQVEIHVKKMHN